MSEDTNKSSDRLISLDVFRGITVAGMVLVNNPGNWSAVYAPLEHAAWNGWTPTDLIFPFFLFIVGISISLALGRRVEQSAVNRDVYLKIFRRSAIIFALGLFQMAFPFFDLAHLRFPGVLQRIAVCYLISSLIFLHTNWKQQIFIIVGCLLFYWLMMTLVAVPGGVAGDLTPAGNFAGYIDRLVIGQNHMYAASKFFDPEGIFSTIPAIATCLAGVLTGTWLKTRRNDLEKVSAVFFFGTALTAIGWIWNFWFPINKSLWTSSYTIFTAGLALCFFGFCYWLIDIKNYRKWAKPFIIFGSNALTLYFCSSIFARIMNNISWNLPDGTVMNVQSWIFKTCFAPLASPFNASLIYSVSYIFLWLFLMWLLYRKRIFVKV
ncbi:MAG: acyltransferase family protein [Pyrinomonadaceae bacterium]